MKHYANYTGLEHWTFIERGWRGMKRIQRKARSATKRGYHKRERAAIKRMTNDLVAEELGFELYRTRWYCA